MTLATVLVLFIIAVELYRPIIIGNAIDQYINGYYHPYVEADVSASDAVNWNGLVLSRDQAVSKADSASFYQIFLWKDHYYMAENLTRAECTALQNADTSVLKNYVREGAQKLTSNDLKVLRQNDFKGILKAGILFLLLLFSGFFLNLADTWLLQKMGQQIVYKLREETFTHIHSLSLSFFNTTPVGKLVTRVSNDTEAVNELFSTILVKLFKNVVKIIGYAVVMLSINVKMAGISFLLLPLVAILTFVFRHLSRKAYQITRNKITELNTFLSEHISGMKLIQIFAREKEKYSEFEGKSMELYRANFREIMTFAIFRPSIYLVSVIAMILVIRTGSLSVLNGSLSLGTLFVFITYISSFFEPIQELSEQLGTLQSSIASAEKIFSVLDVKPEIVSPADPAPVNILGEIEFRHVWFAYEEENYILKDVSFVIHPGEKAAFVGATGAGKSTILKIITGVLNPTDGEVKVNGRISALLELGAGFNMEYTGIENIYLNGTMIGFTKEEIDEKLQDILDFADIGDFVNQPVKTYSSGMFVRLAFAVAINIEPEILIVDEALSVGDVFFQTKCYHKFEEFKKMGKTILFVSHDLGSIGKYCDRVVLLNKGVKLAEGKPKDMIDLYKRVMAESKMEDSPKKEDGHAAIEGVAWKESMILNPDKQEYGDKKAEIIDFGIFDATGKITNTVSKFEECVLKLKVQFHEDVLNPIFAFTIRDLKGTDLTGTNSLIEGLEPGLIEAGTTLTVSFRQKLPFQKGQYLLQLGCTGYNGDELEVHHRLYDICCIQVLSKKVTVGYFDLNSIVS